MHAVLVKVKLSDNPDPTILREQVVPRVKAASRLRGCLLDPGRRDRTIDRRL